MHLKANELVATGFLAAPYNSGLLAYVANCGAEDPKRTKRCSIQTLLLNVFFKPMYLLSSSNRWLK